MKYPLLFTSIFACQALAFNPEQKSRTIQPRATTNASSECLSDFICQDAEIDGSKKPIMIHVPTRRLALTTGQWQHGPSKSYYEIKDSCPIQPGQPVPTLQLDDEQMTADCTIVK